MHYVKQCDLLQYMGQSNRTREYNYTFYRAQEVLATGPVAIFLIGFVISYGLGELSEWAIPITTNNPDFADGAWYFGFGLPMTFTTALSFVSWMAYRNEVNDIGDAGYRHVTKSKKR